MIRAAALAAVAVLAAGCGSTMTRTVMRVQRCNGIAADLTFHYAICGDRFMRDAKVLAIGKPPGAKVGHWAKAYLSPDDKTLLAQWSSECEVPYAFLVPARGGALRVVTGEANWAKARPSVADGWTEDGRAIVEVWRTDCGAMGARDMYLVAQDGTRTAIG